MRNFREAGIARFFFMGVANVDSIHKTADEVRFIQLCEKCLSPKGFRVVDVDCQLAARSILRVFVEKSDKDGTNLDDCAQASRELDPVLEAEPWIPGGFDLEVSSPGLERRLRLAEDFAKMVGETVKLKLVEKTAQGAQNLTGQLLEATPHGIKLNWQGQEVLVAYANIRRAHRVWNFKS